MQIDILTPEHKLYSGDATAVQLPGKDGLFQVLENHAPIISTLKEGELKIDLPAAPKGEKEWHPSVEQDGETTLKLKIKGGVAEMQGKKLIILAD
jgi:F-type H+-transporting ATPase subunit epsilon